MLLCKGKHRFTKQHKPQETLGMILCNLASDCLLQDMIDDKLVNLGFQTPTSPKWREGRLGGRHIDNAQGVQVETGCTATL